MSEEYIRFQSNYPGLPNSPWIKLSDMRAAFQEGAREVDDLLLAFDTQELADRWAERGDPEPSFDQLASMQEGIEENRIKRYAS